MKVLNTVFALLTRKERLQLLGLGSAMTLTGVVEMLGVASVLPFMQLVADPGALERDTFVAALYARLGFASPASALFAMGLFLLVVIALNNTLTAGTLWLTQRYAWGLNHRLSTDLLGSYLNQSYSFFLGRNTAELNRTLLQAVHSVVTGVLIPALQVAARGITGLLIVAVLAVADLRLAVVLGVVFGGAYALVYALVRRSQQRLGWEQFNNNGRRFLIAQEALTGIKDVKTLGREDEFMRRFADPSRRYSLAAADNQIVSRIPRYALETVAFGGILVILLVAIRRGQDIGALLPPLALYAFAGYRLMPALNELFSSVILIRFNTAAVEALDADLGVTARDGSAASRRDGVRNGDGARGAHGVRADDIARAGVPGLDNDPGPEDDLPEGVPLVALDDVTFRYPGGDRDTLSHVSLSVAHRQIVGLVGTTGAGKTTIVDLLLGLLEPTSGAVRVEGRDLRGGDARRWRTRCGYVPQDVFLSDDTLAANIAFGLPESEIDMDAVRSAARVAQVEEFVDGLAEGFDTVIGERGVRLSGGQRQRIGIARALYHDPDVLVMDEATNALDSVTETAVIDTIQRLAHRKTLVVIAHRLSTVRGCDRLYLLDGGTVAATGTYDELYERDPRFRALVGEMDAPPAPEPIPEG